MLKAGASDGRALAETLSSSGPANCCLQEAGHLPFPLLHQPRLDTHLNCRTVPCSQTATTFRNNSGRLRLHHPLTSQSPLTASHLPHLPSCRPPLKTSRRRATPATSTSSLPSTAATTTRKPSKLTFTLESCVCLFPLRYLPIGPDRPIVTSSCRPMVSSERCSSDTFR
jgi:hypothetical protein